MTAKPFCHNHQDLNCKGPESGGLSRPIDSFGRNSLILPIILAIQGQSGARFPPDKRTRDDVAGETRPAKILIVEDEPLIRIGIVIMLERSGFEAIEADTADEAIKIIEARGDIRLVVTDVDMPGTMDGVKLAHYIRRKWPPIKLIVISGKVGLSTIDLPTGARFFSKPYEDATLLNTIDRMIAGNGNGNGNGMGAH